MLTPISMSKIKVVKNKNNKTITHKKAKHFRSRAASLNNNSFSPIIFTTSGNTGFCAHPEWNLMHIIPEQRRQYNNYLACDPLITSKTNNSRESINSSIEPVEEHKIESITNKDLIITYENRIRDLEKVIKDNNKTIEWMKRTTRFTKVNEIIQENHLLISHIRSLNQKLMVVSKTKKDLSHAQINHFDPNNQDSFDSSTEIALSPYRSNIYHMESSNSPCSKRTKLDILVENYNESFKTQNLNLKQENDKLKQEKNEKKSDQNDNTPHFKSGTPSNLFVGSPSVAEPIQFNKPYKMVKRDYSHKPFAIKNQSSKQVDSNTIPQINVTPLNGVKLKTLDREKNINPITQRDSDKSFSNKSSQLVYDKKNTIIIKPTNNKTLEIVQIDEIDHLIPKIRFILQVFGTDLYKMMFADLHNVSLYKAKEAFSNMLEIKSIESENLSRYIIEPRNNSKIEEKKYDLNINKVINNIEELTQPYSVYSNETIVNYINEFKNEENYVFATKLLNCLKEMEVVQSITVDQMRNEIDQLFLDSSKSSNSNPSSSPREYELCNKPDTDLILAYLMRESKSASNISSDAMKTLLNSINSLLNGTVTSIHKNNKKLINPCFKREYHIRDSDIGDTEPEPIEEFISERAFSDESRDASEVPLGDLSEIGDKELTSVMEDFFIKLSKFLIQKNKTLFDIVYECVYDMIFNNLEVQLIDSYYLFLYLENNGFIAKKENKVSIVKGLKYKHSLNGIDILNLQSILEELGAPCICKDSNYKELKGYEIRIFNRIIKKMNSK